MNTSSSLPTTTGRGPPQRQDDLVLRSNEAAPAVKHIHTFSNTSFHPAHSLPSPSLSSNFNDETNDSHPPSRDNCDRRRPDEEELSRLPNMSQQLVGKMVTPFLREHIPGIYAPLGKPETLSMAVVPAKDANSKLCYRHRPDSKCRRAADETKMAMIQSVRIISTEYIVGTVC
jgi:F-box/WD-40 domain protein MET30